MFLILFLFTWAAYVQSLNNMVPTRWHLSTNHRIAVTSVSLSSSSFDKDMTELSKLSRTELQTLSKEYGLKATLKTAELIINLEMAISSIDDSERSRLPSATETLKLSPLEKTVTVKSTDINSAKYKVENSNPNIGDILKEQGVRIDDLMALRDSLMKGGFKFNDDQDEGDYEESDEELSEEDIDREFYGEDFDSEMPRSSVQSKSSGERGSSKTAADAIAQEAERSAANTLKSKAIKEAKRLAKLDGKPASKARKVEAKVKPPRPAAGYEKKSVVMADLDGILMKDSVTKEYQGKEEDEDEDEDLFEQLGMMEVNVRSRIPDKKEDSGPKSSTAVPVKVQVTVAPAAVAATTAVTAIPAKKAVEPVYVKLKRRVVEEEEESESESEGESDTLGDLDRLMSLEDLGNRMDQLYGDSDTDPESDPVSDPTVVKVVKGSDSKNPIKWRNGRLVNDKDRFYGEIRSQAVSDSSSGEEGEEDGGDSDREGGEEGGGSGARKKGKSNSKKAAVELTGVTMKIMLEHLETSIGFDGLFEETNLRCFSVKPSVNSSLKVLRQLPLEWARKKIEYLYIQSKKRQ